MPIANISDADSRYFYNGYRIFRSSANSGCWGIKSPSGEIVIEPIFQCIYWLKNLGPNNTLPNVHFKLNGKEAVCTFEQMLAMKKH